METLLLKKEWIVHCNNCGNPNHCNNSLNRKEVDEFGEQYEIEVCKICRCEACQ
jgi:hypothetical protein